MNTRASCASLAIALSAIALPACSSSPTGPSTHSTATIAGIRSSGTRFREPSGFADLGETLTVTATVLNLDPTADSVEYRWSGPGTFSGDGPTVSWRAPAALSKTPETLTLTLSVIERHQRARIFEGTRTSQTFTVRVHDSQKEILDMGDDFLTLFSRNQVPTNEVLHNFSTTCDGGRGRTNEASDTDAARAKYQQDFSRFRIERLPPVTYNFGGACLVFGSRIRPADACSLFRVHWEFTYLVAEDGHKPGDRGVTDGVDSVTAVVENGDWRLCHSDFNGAN